MNRDNTYKTEKCVTKDCPLEPEIVKLLFCKQVSMKSIFPWDSKGSFKRNMFCLNAGIN